MLTPLPALLIGVEGLGVGRVGPSLKRLITAGFRAPSENLILGVEEVLSASPDPEEVIVGGVPGVPLPLPLVLPDPPLSPPPPPTPEEEYPKGEVSPPPLPPPPDFSPEIFRKVFEEEEVGGRALDGEPDSPPAPAPAETEAVAAAEVDGKDALSEFTNCMWLFVKTGFENLKLMRSSSGGSGGGAGAEAVAVAVAEAEGAEGDFLSLLMLLLLLAV